MKTLRLLATAALALGVATAAHAQGKTVKIGVVVPFTGSLQSPIQGQQTLTEAQMNDFLAGKWYANLHTAAHPGGEIRGWVTGN